MRVHLDHNATTRLRPEVRARWLEVADALGGNASSLHAAGRRARALVDDARERIAAALGVHEEEIVFTSGGTEANHLALWGSLRAAGAGSRLVTTAVEHSSVLESARALAAAGHPLALVPVDGHGVLDLDALGEAAAGAALVSVMAANNEVGSVNDLGRVAARLDGLPPPRPRLHTDAVQALGKLPLALRGEGPQLASFSAHKVGGPTGVGILWRRRGTPLDPLFQGGGQEHGLRPGTENVPGIAAGAVAIELAVEEQPELARRTAELAGELWRALAATVPGIELLGPPLDAPRLPNTLCVRIPGVEGPVLVTRLDLEGLEASAGSACASGSLEPSHVLLAMGRDEEAARSGLRLSLGRDTSRAECDRAAAVVRKLARASRAT